MKRISTRKLRRVSRDARAAFRTRRPRPLSVSLSRFGSMIAVAGALFASMGDAQAGTFYWDPDGIAAGNLIDGTGLGGSGLWSTATSNWWPVPAGPLTTWGNAADDIAIFSGPFSTVPIARTVTLGIASGIQANRLSFSRSGYTLSGGDFTLSGTTPTLQANFAEYATINSQILGSGGLTITGGGSFLLGNATNLYTGTTTINNGSLVIANNGALGTDTSTVVVSGSNTRGLGGGALVLAGDYASGVNLARNLSLQGQGTIPANSAALISVRNNTVSGNISVSSTPALLGTTRIMSAGGRLTLAGGLDVPGAAATNFVQIGGANSVGTGSYAITGTLTGTGTLEKTTAGTLLLGPTDSTSFGGTLRMSAGGTVRISTAGALGTRTATTTGSVLDMNNGSLEVLMDTPSLLAGGAAAHFYGRNNGVIFVDHSAGGSTINGTAAFGQFAFEEAFAYTFNGRNGYGISFGNAPVQGGNGNTTLTNNLSGVLTFTAALWGNSENTASRNLTFAGNGDSLLSGNFNASATSFAHTLTKTGTGTLTINGTASSLDGAVNINGGTIAINDFRSLNNATSAAAINIGTGATAGVLTIGTTGTATTAGLVATGTTARVINLAGTTGGATINASQTLASPVTIGNNFTATGTGAKTLTLGGTSTQINAINGVIPNNGTNATSLVKTGVGTWALGASNTYTGSTTVANGILRLNANAPASTIIADTSAIIFNTDATTLSAGGTLQFVGTTNGATTETLGALTPTAGAGTITLTQGNAGSTANLIFSSLGAVGRGSGINISSGTTASTVTVTGTPATTATTLPGNGHIYINGADFAAVTGTAFVAPAYTAGGATFTTAAAGASTLVASKHNAVTGNITAQTAVAVSSLKIAGNQTLTLAGNLTINLGVSTDAGLLQTGGSAAVINGSGLITSGGTGAVVIRVNAATDVLTLGSGVNIGSSTTGGLTKNGAGRLVIQGTNAQTGTTSINEGTVQLSGASARLSGSGVTLDLRQGATLDLNGQSSGTAIGVFNGAGTVTNSSTNAATLILGNAGGGGIFSGVIQDGAGVMNLTHTQATGRTLSGANTFTGVATIGTATSTGGVVAVPILANIGTASGIGRGLATDDTTNAASLVFGGATTVGINYTGTTSVSIDRLFTLNGVAANPGGQIANSSANNSALIFNKTNPIAFGPNATAAQTLTLGGASTADNRINLQIIDNGALPTSVSKIGAGQWVLGGASNTYSGTTTIGQGVLVANDFAGLSNNSGLILGATTTTGIFQSSGTFARTISVVGSAGINTVTWNGTSGGGGFAANDSTKFVVALGGVGSPSALTWGSGGFVGTNAGTSAQTLFFNSATALGEVEFRNPIDLAGAVRTIQVDDNANTQTDFATITGVLSGSGTSGISKAGAGILQLFGANGYTGTTAVTAGQLVVTSLGLSTSPGTSSVGDSTAGATDAGAVTLGNGGTGAGILQYVGAGETSDRKIRFNTTTGNTQIHADGSGPLVLTNVLNDMATAAKTLFLRGSNTSGNMISSILADNTGALGVTVDSNATWILAGASSYTGATTASAGALGAGNDSGFGAGTVNVGNGTLFAFGADRTLGNAFSQANNTNTAFIGDYSFSMTGNYAFGAAGTAPTLTNHIGSGPLPGKALTFNTVTFNALTANRTWTINGTGDTVVGGNITTSTSLGVPITYSGTGSLTLSGTGSNYGQNNAATTLSSGTLKNGNSQVIPDGAGKGNVVISPAAAITATYNLNGFNETINGLTANSAGNTVIDNTSGTPSTLTFGVNDQAVTLGGGGGTYTITDSGASTLSIVKSGTSAATLTATGGTLTYSGATSVTGGTMNVGPAVNGTSGLSVTGVGSILALTGGVTAPSAATSITVTSGSTLSLLDGAGNRFTNLGTLTLGETGGTNTTLNFNVGDGGVVGDNVNTDLFKLTALGTLNLFTGNTITFNLTDAGLNANTDYVLLDASLIGGGFFGGASPHATLGAGYLLGGVPGGFTSIDLTTSSTNTQIIIHTGSLITGSLYWRGLVGGGTDTTWNANVNNWSQNKGNSLVATTLPGAGTDVIFQADALSNAAVTTTLEQNFKIKSLTFEADTVGANTATAITINPGAFPTNRIEISPQSSTTGLTISAGGTPVVTIAAAVRAGADQTWNVADSSTVLTVSGALSGPGNISKTGPGKVTLSGAGTGYTGTFTAGGGNTEITAATALSGIVATPGSGAPVNIASTGGFYFNGATATIPNNLTLSGGTLSAGRGATTAPQTITYSGSANISAASFINLRDANSAVVSTTQNNITLSGAVTGAGSLTIDSSSVLSAGNANNGTVTLSNTNTSWSGDLNLTRGTVLYNSGVSPSFTGNNLNFNLSGRLQLSGVQGTTLSRTGTLNYAAGALGELSVTNASASPTLNYTVSQNGASTFGSSGTGATVRIFLGNATSNMAITGGITLGGNSSLTAVGGDADSLVTISGIGINDGGNNYSLAINDEAGSWGVTSTRVAINASSTYTGGTSLNEGILLLGNKDALGTGTLTITNVSTLTPMVDISAGGVGVLPNALTLGGTGTTVATLTVSGTNNLTVDGAFIGTSTDFNRTLTNNITSTQTLLFSGSATIASGLSNTAAHTLTLSGTGNTVVNNGFVDGNASANSLAKTGTGTLTLNGTATYTGGTSLGGGTLILNSKDAIGTGVLTVTAASNLQAGVDLSGLNTVPNALTLNNNLTVIGSNNLTIGGTFIGTGGSANRTLTNNITGGQSLVIGGAVVNIGAPANTAALTLIFAGTANTAVTNPIVNGNTFNNALLKNGTGTLTFNGNNTYAGATSINQGSILLGTNQTMAGSLVFGNATSVTTAGNFDLSSFSATVTGALTAQNNTTSASTITIGAGQTLQINNNVQIGATTPAANNTVTKLTMSGAGVFNVTAAAGTFAVGGNTSTSTALSEDATLDLSGLSATTISVGTVRISNNTGTNTAGSLATLLLPTPAVSDATATTTITANTFGVGVGGSFNSGAGQVNSVILGTGLTTVNATTINVGTGARDIGVITFANANGDLIIRAADGSSRAALNIGTGGAGTGTTNALANTLVDFTGHDTDLLLSTLNVGNQARLGNLISEFKFGSASSVLDVTNVNIGFRTGTATATSVLTDRVNFTAGTIILGNAGGTGTGVVIGNSTYSGAGAASTIGELNISGGTVTIHNSTSLGAAIQLGANVAAGAGTVTAALNLTGGTITVNGNIVRNATAPRTTSTILLSGASLDLTGKNIGTATETIALAAQSGTLSNLAELNGGGTLTKSTAGVLLMGGANTYTAPTDIQAGEVKATSATGLSAGSTFNVTASSFLTLDGNSSSIGNLSGAGNVRNQNAGNATLTVGANGSSPAAFSGVLEDGAGGGVLSLVKTGAGTTTLSGLLNTYTGTTTVNAGTLSVTGGPLSTSVLTVAGGATFSLNNALGQTMNLGAGVLTFGGATASNFGFDLGTPATSDRLTSASAAITTGNVVLNLTALPDFAGGTYELFTAASGLDGATYTVGANPGGLVYTISTAPAFVRLTTSVLAGDLYWRGAVNSLWSGFAPNLDSNFTTDAAGLVNAKGTPGAANRVIFSAPSAGGPAISTSLAGSLTIADLEFTANPTGVTSVAIAPGTPANSTLTIAPAVNTDGIAIAANAGNIAISAPLVLGAAQTWAINGTGASLALSGGITGGAGNSLTLTATAGTPVITLTGVNPYSGATSIGAGVTLAQGAGNALPLNSAVAVDGTLSTGAFAGAVGSLATGTGIVENGSATNAILTVGGDGTSQSFGGTLRNGSTGTLAMTKIGAGSQTFTGTYSYTGATLVNGGILRLAGTPGTTAVTVNAGGTLQLGTATALTSANNVTLVGTGILDLAGNNATVGTLTSAAATSTITNSGAGLGTNTLNIDPLVPGIITIAAAVNDGATAKTAIRVTNSNAGTQITTNPLNTYSGGLILANPVSGAGTRLAIGTITGTPWGTGPITVGEAATDRAGIFFATGGQTLANPIIINTALGTDRVGIRSDAAATLSGKITANLAPATFTSNAASAGSFQLTGQITGAFGVVLDITSLAAAATSFAVTLNHAGTANDYAGDTVINLNAATGKSATLNLGAANQIPNGTGTGNVVINTNGTGIGTLNLAGFSETINGLSGNGIVEGGSGTPTLTLGDNNATGQEFSGVIKNTTGTLAVTKIGGGIQTLSGSNSFSGALNLNGGTLVFATSNNLGNASTTNTLGFNGGALSYTGPGALDLTSNRSVTIGASGATLEVTQSTGVLTTGAVAGSGNLTKTGIGTVILPSSITLGAGAVTVSAGILRAGFGTGGITALTVGAVGNMELRNNAAEVLTLGGTAGALNLSGGASLGFELGTLGMPGTGDQLIVNSGGTAVTSGTITLNFFNLPGFGAGTYNLLSAPSGLGGGLGTTYTLGTAPTGFNYTITANDTLVSLGVMAFVPRYWTGSQATTSWATTNGVGPFTTNWSTDASGATNYGALPGAADTVIFSATNAAGGAIVTTLDGSFTIEGLYFINAPTTPATTTVAINQGTLGDQLTLKPISTTGGIVVAANAGNETINAAVVALTPQTWSIDGTGLSSLTIGGANASVAFTSRVTKTGAGALTLGSANTGTGGLLLTAGTLNINHNTALGTGTLTIGPGTTIDSTVAGVAISNVQQWNGSFAFTGTQDLDLGAGPVTLGSSLGVLTATAGKALTVRGIIDDGINTFGLTKAGAGTLVLNGAIAYGGLTDLVQGALTLAGDNTGAVGGVTMAATSTLNINHPGALGTGTFRINGGTIDNTSGAPITASTNPTQVWNGNFAFTGSNDLDLGTGAVALRAAAAITTTGATKILTVGGAIDDGPASNFNLTKAGGGTLKLTGLSATAASNYGGATTVDQGRLILTSASTVNLSGALIFGTASASPNFGALDLTGANASFSGLTAQNNNATANTIDLGSKTLTINGSVSVGNASVPTGQQTHLTVTGATGTLAVNLGTAGTFRTGNFTGGTNIVGLSAVDLSGLANFTVTGGATSAFTVATAGDNSATGVVSMRLANTANSLQATTLTVGAAGSGAQQSLRLGNGTGTTNVLNIDTLNIGTGIRDGGLFSFDSATGLGTGSVSISNRLNSGPTTFNMGTGASTDTIALNNVFDVTGHPATLNFGAGTVGTQNARAGGGSNTFSFDRGTLTFASLTASTRGVAGTMASTFNFGSASSTLADTVTITNGILQLGLAQTVGTAVAVGTVNIAGGTVNIGSTAQTSISMGSSTFAGATSTALINLTGGTTTLTGNIVRVGGVGTANATVTLNGASAVLDMSFRDIGTGASAVTFNAQAGTLRNLGELNGGGASVAATLDKTTTGTLRLETGNAYTGFTTVSGGVLQIAHASALGGGALGTTVTGTGAALELSNNIAIPAEALTLNGTGIGGLGALRSTSGTNTYGGAITVQTSSSIGADPGSILNLPGGINKNLTTLTLTGGGTINLTAPVTGASAGSDLVVDGATVSATAINTYQGATFIRSNLTGSGILNANALNALPTLNGRSAVTMDDSGLGGSQLNLGASQSIASLTGAVTSTVGLGGNSLTIGTVSGSATFAGAITGSGGVTKDSGSTQELSGANTYSGLTTVTSGVLVVSGSLSGTTGVEVSSLLSTDAAASIGTASAGNVNLQTGGTLAPGGLAAAGTLTLGLGAGGKLDFAAGSTLALDLGTSADRVTSLSVGDWLSGGGTGTTLALDITGPGFDYNNTYVIFENVNTPGFSFGEITGFDTVNVLAQFAQNGDRYELSFAAVPEPSSMALVAAAGLLGLAGYRGRRRRGQG